MALNPFDNQQHTGPATRSATHAISDVTTYSPPPRGFIPDADGVLAWITVGGDSSTSTVVGGALYPISIVQALSTGTSGVASVTVVW